MVADQAIERQLRRWERAMFIFIPSLGADPAMLP